jgi:hypothetical protein
MLTKTLCVALLLLCSALASAQTLTDSGQCHWLQTNGMLGHTHIDLDTVDRPSVRGVLRVGFTITLFHTSATIGEYYAGNAKTSDAFDWVWDDTGTSTPPLLMGDEMGVKTWSGHFSVIPNIPHGWEWVSMSVYTRFSDRTTVVILNEPIYSLVDPSKPSPNDTDPAAQRAQAVCRVSPDPQHPESFYGEQTAQFDSALPRTTVTAPVPMTGSTYGYGARGLPLAQADFVLDMNLHASIPGTELLVASEPADGLVHVPMNFDPAVTGPGTHKFVVRRTQTNGPELSAVLLVTLVKVDPKAPAASPPPAPVVGPPSSAPVVGSPSPAPVVGSPLKPDDRCF